MIGTCILWTKSKDRKGYGKLGFNGKPYLAHRWYWEQQNGPIPEGMCVCHSCDNPSCVNVAHLFLGTNYDNVQDRVSKGRSATFKTNKGNSKFTEEVIIYIRSSSEAPTEIMKKIKISKAQLYKIRRGICWKPQN